MTKSNEPTPPAPENDPGKVDTTTTTRNAAGTDTAQPARPAGSSATPPAGEGIGTLVSDSDSTKAKGLPGDPDNPDNTTKR
jgi:hypothetical protein